MDGEARKKHKGAESRGAVCSISVVATPLIPTLGKHRRANLGEFRDRLVYTAIPGQLLLYRATCLKTKTKASALNLSTRGRSRWISVCMYAGQEEGGEKKEVGKRSRSPNSGDSNHRVLLSSEKY